MTKNNYIHVNPAVLTYICAVRTVLISKFRDIQKRAFSRRMAVVNPTKYVHVCLRHIQHDRGIQMN